MRNLYILPTTNPSNLFENLLGKLVITREYHPNTGVIQNRDVYITSDEDPKLDEWGINLKNNVVFKCKGFSPTKETKEYHKKIILTTNRYLIKDGVQAIDEEFLEWIVKNTNCEEVEVQKNINTSISVKEPYYHYKIIVPKEDLGYNTNLGVKVPDKMVRAFIVPKELFGSRQFVGNSSKYKTEDYDELGRS